MLYKSVGDFKRVKVFKRMVIDKITMMVMAFTFLSGATAGLLAQTVANAEDVSNKRCFADYVSVEDAPTIDGYAEDVWNRVINTLETGITDEGTKAKISILWNETGLYFFADVTDFTVNDTDLCNFWVSEEYITGNSKYVNKTYPEVEGSYYLCLNPNGENAFYHPDNFEDNILDMTGKYTVASTKNDEGYTLELYVPITGNKNLQENSSIGFDVSIDDYLTEGIGIEDREAYVNWNGQGWYWENPERLGKVVLVDSTDSNKVPENNTNNGSETLDNMPETSPKKSGCSSTLHIGGGLAVFAGILIASIIFIKRKKNT